MHRFYLSTIVGSGTEEDPYRPRIADLTGQWHATLPSDATGKPASTWCLVQAGDVPDDPDVTPLVASSFERGVDGLAAAEQARLKSELDKVGVAFTKADTLADVIERTGRKLEPTFFIRHG